MPDEQNPNESPTTLWYGARKHYLQSDPTAPNPTAPLGEQNTGMKIAIQGEPGSFSHEAAMKLVEDAVIAPFALSADAFSALSNGAVDAAVVPIENSLAGSVSEHFDLLLAHDVRVEREALLRIRHNLIAISGSSISNIDRVFSHPVALAQCRAFLASHPRMEAFAFYDTAGKRQAARRASRPATPPPLPLRRPPVTTVRRSSSPASKTIPKTSPASSSSSAPAISSSIPAPTRSSIAFSVENRPGSLVSALSELSTIGTNLTKIESSAPSMASPGNISSTSTARFNPPTKAPAPSTPSKSHCSMVKELGRYTEARQP